MEKIALDSNFFAKKVAAKEIFGSNLTLKNREAVGNGLNPWAELRSARQNPAKNDLNLIAERDTRIELASLAWEASVLPLY